MSVIEMAAGSDTSDAELVLASRRGDRGAFGRIVARHQQLVCSLAYAATGDLARSEDVAQETFVVAWSELAGLREPARLRGWLCGILRNLLSRHHRDASREPSYGAGPISEAGEVAESADPGPAARLLEAEEQALLWRSLERIPAQYREPLVLFYRERRSVAEVAEALELSDEAVRQRLARGRRLLAEEVQAFVEGALERTAPGKAFTLAVLAALPAAGVPGKAAAAVLAPSVKAAAGGLAGAAAIAGSLASGGLSVAANLAAARTPEERGLVLRSVGTLLAAIAASVAGFLLLAAWARAVPGQAVTAAAAGSALALLIPAGLVAWLWRLGARFRSIALPGGRPPYRSRAAFLGMPLVHVMWTNPAPGTAPAIGWIAVGDRAVGGLFALGAFALAPVAVGSCAVGLVSLGVLGIGVLGIGTLALGLVALGSAAAGYTAGAGVFALGIHSASSGGLAVARDLAAGNPGLARVTGEAASAALRAGAWPPWVFPLIVAAMGVVPLALYLREMRAPRPS